MQTNQNLYDAHACCDNDVLSDEYYSQFTDLVLKQIEVGGIMNIKPVIAYLEYFS